MSNNAETEFKPENKMIQANIGDKLSDVAEAAGVKINYKCKKVNVELVK
jgi:ferredoxin